MFGQDQPVVSILVTQDDPWLTLLQQNIEPCLTFYVVQGEEWIGILRGTEFCNYIAMIIRELKFRPTEGIRSF